MSALHTYLWQSVVRLSGGAFLCSSELFTSQPSYSVGIERLLRLRSHCGIVQNIVWSHHGGGDTTTAETLCQISRWAARLATSSSSRRAIMPDFSSVARVAVAKPKAKRGRRSAIQMAIAREHPAEVGPPMPSDKQAEHLARARRAKEEKAARVASERQGQSQASEAVVAFEAPLVAHKAHLTEDVLVNIQAGPASVFGASPLHDLVLRAGRAPTTLDDGIRTVVDEFCRKSSHRVGSKAVRSDALGVSVKETSKLLPQGSSALINADHG